MYDSICVKNSELLVKQFFFIVIFQAMPIINFIKVTPFPRNISKNIEIFICNIDQAITYKPIKTFKLPRSQSTYVLTAILPFIVLYCILILWTRHLPSPFLIHEACYRMFQNLSESSRRFCDFLKSFRRFKKALECSKMF